MMEINEIKNILPHRYPFLLVDRILECGDGRVVGIKNVTVNEPFFEGHFPDRPIMPGVLIIEAMAQTGGILAYSIAPQYKGRSILFIGIDKVRFRRQVVPGDQLVLKLKVLKQRGSLFKMRAEAFVDDQLAAEAELMATIDVNDALVTSGK